MKRVFIIGGMGAGKSSVSRLLSRAGLPVVDLDVLGHQALESGAAKASLAEAFGRDILNEDGSVNRKALAACAFASAERTATLNKLQLPRIKALLEQRMDAFAAEGADVAVVEYSAYAPGPEEPFVAGGDMLVAVVAPLEARLARLERAGWNEEDARARIARQITDKQRRACADYIICNDGDEDRLASQVNVLLRMLGRA